MKSGTRVHDEGEEMVPEEREGTLEPEVLVEQLCGMAASR